MLSTHERIQSTLREFKKLSAELEEQNIDASLINQAIKKFEMKASPKPLKESKTLDKIVEQRGVHSIFEFYAKQHKTVRPKVTFDEYSHECDGLQLGEFLVFCRDFKIYAKDCLNKNDLIEIFKVNCSFKKQMNESEFILALQHLANKLFTQSPKDNLKKLYEYIRINDEEYIRKTAKGTKLPFSNEKLNFRSSMQKIRLPSEKNLPRVSQISSKRNLSNYEPNKRTSQALLPCDAIAIDVKKNSYSSNMLKKLNPMTFTWQTLTSLNTDQYSSMEKLNALIITNDSDDEILEKHYGSLLNTPVPIYK